MGLKYRTSRGRIQRDATAYRFLGSRRITTLNSERAVSGGINLAAAMSRISYPGWRTGGVSVDHLLDAYDDAAPFTVSDAGESRSRV